MQLFDLHSAYIPVNDHHNFNRLLVSKDLTTTNFYPTLFSVYLGEYFSSAILLLVTYKDLVWDLWFSSYTVFIA